MQEPRIVERDGFTVVGMEYFGTNENMEIPLLWNEFFKRIHEITNPSQQGVAYGVCDGTTETGEFSYLACIAVKDESQIPKGMKSKQITSGTYAVFTHKGTLDKLKETYAEIFTEWLPKSGYDSYDFDFELYDERSKDFTSEDSEMDIYIPLKPKMES